MRSELKNLRRLVAAARTTADTADTAALGAAIEAAPPGARGNSFVLDYEGGRSLFVQGREVALTRATSAGVATFVIPAAEAEARREVAALRRREAEYRASARRAEMRRALAAGGAGVLARPGLKGGALRLPTWGYEAGVSAHGLGVALPPEEDPAWWGKQGEGEFFSSFSATLAGLRRRQAAARVEAAVAAASDPYSTRRVLAGGRWINHAPARWQVGAMTPAGRVQAVGR